MFAKIETLPLQISSNAIGLPTNGAVIDKVKENTKGAPHWRVDGRILPVDPEADPIGFRVLVPQGAWNGRILHVGGGGFDGSLPLMNRLGIGLETWYGVPIPVAQGYVVYGSDSGHQAPQFDATNAFAEGTAGFALNDEMHRNFAHEAIKKVHDVAVAIVGELYGRAPEHSYFAGTSNGGRGALMAAQRYGDDYDGIISGYPCLHWVSMLLYGLACYRAQKSAGEEGHIDAETWARIEREVIAFSDELDGRMDGIVCNYPAAFSREDALYERLSGFLNPAQMDVLRTCMGELDLSFLGGSFPRFPGYSLALGEPLRDDYNPTMVLNCLDSVYGAGDGFITTFTRESLAKQVIRSRDFDLGAFVPEEHVDELHRASELLDATSTDFSAFRANGGKAILYHGTYDQLVSVRGTFIYHDALKERYGDELRDFLRLFVIPGAGHLAGLFDPGMDLLGALDAWVTDGTAPEGLVAHNRREDYGPREMPLCEWPSWPRYVGGDPDKASSYEVAF